MSLSRRLFLRGLGGHDAEVPRPPWAATGIAFEARCTRCGECLEVCPTRIIVAAAGGFPRVDFARGECTFCGDCVAACRTQALSRNAPDAPPWTLQASLGEACLAPRGVECRVCGEACTTGAIRFRPAAGGVARPVFDASRCTGCGACLAPCPAGAIAVNNTINAERAACR